MNPLEREHEEATIRAFVLRGRQERFLSLLASPKGRSKFTNELGHFRWFDPKYCSPLPWKVDPTLSLHGRHVQGIHNIVNSLKSKGAGLTCWVISERKSLDMRELDLEVAIAEISGGGSGTILSCIPGKLAYFEGEEEALLLAR